MPLLKRSIRHSPISKQFYNILDFVYCYKSYLVRFISIQRIFRENFFNDDSKYYILERVLSNFGILKRNKKPKQIPKNVMTVGLLPKPTIWQLSVNPAVEREKD